MAFTSVAEGKEFCWKWLRNRPFARMVYTHKFTVEELSMIAERAKLLTKPREKPLIIARKRKEV
jgi:hypothetical protein